VELLLLMMLFQQYMVNFVGKKTITTVDGPTYVAVVSVDGVEQEFVINNDFTAPTAGDFVSVEDENKAGYNKVAAVGPVTIDGTTIDSANKTFADTAATPNTYGVTSNTTIYVYDVSDETLVNGVFVDIDTAVTNSYGVQLDTTGVTYGAGSSIQEAGVIYITKP
jgi:hypothetical protein